MPKSAMSEICDESARAGDRTAIRWPRSGAGNDAGKLPWAAGLSSYGHGNGISLRIRDEDRLRRQLVMVLLEHLADPSGEDQGVLTEAIFGPDASDDQKELIGAALRDVLHERDEA